jgi:hypothetical protein
MVVVVVVDIVDVDVVIIVIVDIAEWTSPTRLAVAAQHCCHDDKFVLFTGRACWPCDCGWCVRLVCRLVGTVANGLRD